MDAEIIIIDDDRELGAMLSEFLAPDHFRLQAFNTGEAGLVGLQKQEFDLAILDIMLPKRDGFSVIEEMRAAGLTALDVQQSLLRENVTLPAGNVKTGSNDLYVRAMGEVPSVGAVARTVVATAEGHPIRVRDVPSSRSQADSVENTSRKGRPAENPRNTRLGCRA